MQEKPIHNKYNGNKNTKNKKYYTKWISISWKNSKDFYENRRCS